MNKNGLLRLFLGLEWLFLSIAVILVVRNLNIVNKQILIVMSEHTKILLLFDIALLFVSAFIRNIFKYKLTKITYNSCIISCCAIIITATIVFIYFITNLY